MPQIKSVSIFVSASVLLFQSPAFAIIPIKVGFELGLQQKEDAVRRGLYECQSFMDMFEKVGNVYLWPTYI